MIQFIRFLFFPFAVIYDFVTRIRNYFYDKGIFKSKKYDLSTIVVGNLSVGGTGKTPMVEYLINLLSNEYKTAILSRGYKRKSKGFILANENSRVEDLGDEPFQFFYKYKNINVAVDANRQNGIEQLTNLKNPEIIILDDCYQHRKVYAKFYILLTKFNDLYINDFLLPTGNLRESKTGANRANVIIVTKCPDNLSIEKQQEITNKLKPLTNQKVFFSTIQYDDYIYNENSKLEVKSITNLSKIVIAGIASPQLFFNFIANTNDEILEFPDHYDFKSSDISSIEKKAENKLIITTEKDYMRLKTKITSDNLYYLPIKTKIINNPEIFNNIIFENIRS